MSNRHLLAKMGQVDTFKIKALCSVMYLIHRVSVTGVVYAYVQNKV